MIPTNPDEKVRSTKFRPDPVPHVRLDRSCPPDCPDQICLDLCPARVFRWEDTPAGRKLAVHHEVCLECGACQHFCPQGTVSFNYPRGGYGVIHRFG